MEQIPKFTITRSKGKTIALQITKQGEIVIKAPLRASTQTIQDFVNKNSQWIFTHLQTLQSHKPAIPKRFTPGETVIYLGKSFTFTPYPGTTIKANGTELLFPEALLFRVEKEMENWYKEKAKDVIMERLLLYAKLMKVTYTAVTFTDTKSQWGRCTFDNRLQFSWRLIMAPILVLNYVVVHELTHITEKNHSRKFWDRMRYFTPSYRHQVKWLSEHGNSLH